MFTRFYTSVVTLCLAACTASMAMPLPTQDKPSPEEFDLLVKSDAPIYVDGERVYRQRELQRKVLILSKPEPSYTDKARENGVEGLVEIRLILSSAGKLKVLHVRKGLPDGLTEQALKAAKKIKFRPGMVDGKPVSTFILAQYRFAL